MATTRPEKPLFDIVTVPVKPPAPPDTTILLLRQLYVIIILGYCYNKFTRYSSPKIFTSFSPSFESPY